MTQFSRLWGENGELWDPKGRLPDFSHAGYHSGERPLPEIAPGTNVREFGAKGDGESDDTAAFAAALAEAPDGAIEIPPGRYVLSDILAIRRPNLVLRGAGTGRTVLFFPKTLQEIHPDWSATTDGRPTSNYSWSGGFVRFAGSFGSELLTAIVGTAERGELAVRVSDPSALHAGQRVQVFQTDAPDDSFAAELYGGDPGNVAKLHGSTTASLICHIVAIDGDLVTFDRPLRFAIRPDWTPQIRRFAPAVSECGIEHLAFEFPVTPYAGHFTEWGYNAIAMEGVADCWARDIHIANADSGLFPCGVFCTLQDIVFTSERPPDAERESTGHHGIYIYGDDNRLTGFDFQTPFIHDITVSKCAGNVIESGRGVDLCFDHHKRAPYENLFTDIDAGIGSRLWQCGGGADLGKHCAARGTFWNIRADRSLKYPPAAFGPASMNVVALTTDETGETAGDGRWFETIPPSQISPSNLYVAQLAHRLSGSPPHSDV